MPTIFADSFAVVAFHHPAREVKCYANYLYTQVAGENLHFHPMTRDEFLHRHCDKF